MSLPCPVQAECGGCGLMPLPLAEQHDLKLEHLRRALEQQRVPAHTVTLNASPRALGYRNRIRLRVEPSGVISFFNESKQASCAVLEPELRDRLSALLALSKAAPNSFAPFSHLELRSDDARGRPAVALGGVHSDVVALREPARALASALRGYLVGVRGDPEIPVQERHIVGDVTALVPLDAFWQVNAEVNALLVAALRAGAVARGLHSLLDLYAGAGNFTLPLARAGCLVCAVEIHAPAVRALSLSAKAQNLVCEAYAEPALSACERLRAEGRRFELVAIDAPRAGARDVVPIAAQLSSRSVVVCSCNPQTLARDLAALVAEGFALDEVQAFDMFPHTHHLEVLAWLTRT